MNKDHTLISPIKRTAEGKLEDVHIVTLIDPVKKFIQKTYKLQQYFKQAQVQQVTLYAGMVLAQSRIKANEEKEEAKEVDLKPGEVMEMLLCSNLDIDDVFSEFERLAMLGAIMIDENKINKKQWDDLEHEDKEALMTKYIAFFISILVQRS
jgi:uncharacterized protein with ParB-like and HNH nuclease domain